MDFASKVVKEEEEGFLRTLEKGITRFNNYTIEVGSSASGYESEYSG
jgi:alanyl-tRNA synthetase